MAEETKTKTAEEIAADAAAAAAKPETKVEKPDSEKTVEELKAEAEALEAELKTAKGDQTEDEVKANMIRRKEKAAEKLAKLKNGEAEPITQPDKGKKDIDTRDLITLGKADIAEDSDQAKILERYKQGGIIKNYADGLNHPGIKAEFEALKSKNDAKTVVDENDSAGNQLKTKKEAIAGYRASGEVPADPALQKAIVEDNLAQMTQLR